MCRDIVCAEQGRAPNPPARRLPHRRRASTWPMSCERPLTVVATTAMRCLNSSRLGVGTASAGLVVCDAPPAYPAHCVLRVPPQTTCTLWQLVLLSVLQLQLVCHHVAVSPVPIGVQDSWWCCAACWGTDDFELRLHVWCLPCPLFCAPPVSSCHALPVSSCLHACLLPDFAKRRLCPSREHRVDNSATDEIRTHAGEPTA